MGHTRSAKIASAASNLDRSSEQRTPHPHRRSAKRDSHAE